MSKEVAEYLVDWLQSKVTRAGAQGVVFGNSGGIDSAVAGVIAKRAFPTNCLSLVLPCETDPSEVLDAENFAKTFGIISKTIKLDTIYNFLCSELDKHLASKHSNMELVKANIKPRLRMLILYYAAQNYNYLVIGTTNLSEMQVGYTTKHGDSGVDLQILGDLLKHEVYELARFLDIPTQIINKPPSAGLWEGQTDEKEMGISYTELDTYIKTGRGSSEVVKVIENLARKSEHKRNLPPIAVIPEDFK